MIPGEAHLVVAASGALDGHVELVPYSLVLLLKENLRSRKEDETCLCVDRQVLFLDTASP